MNYKIITAYTPADLEKLVNEAISQGFVPTGGVAISHGHPVGVGHRTEYTHFSQAVVAHNRAAESGPDLTAAPTAAPTAEPSPKPAKKKFGLF